MAINATTNERDLKIKLPYNVKSCLLWLSTGNESGNLCQKSDIDIEASTNELLTTLPAQSLSTYIFTIDQGGTAIENVKSETVDGPATYYDLQGRLLNEPHGLCIERSANGSTRKVMMR
jgi:glucuronoarabinoxylan endo-1,4-beta-xylanase